MNVLEDPKVQYLLNRRNLSESRIRTYRITLNEIYELIGLTPSELIQEARNQQKPDWEKHIFLEMEDRNITNYFFKYYNYLKSKQNSDGTINAKLIALRAFYKEYNVELPKPIIIKEIKSRARKKDFPSLEDVKKSLDVVESLKYKALILFIFTSGLRIGDVAKLSIQDFLDATKEYHDGTLEDLLTKDPYSIIPVWDLDPQKTKKEGNLCITFNTPETVEAIFNYLNQLKDKNKPFDNDYPLFRTHKGGTKRFYNSKTMGELFNRVINPVMGNHKDKHGYVFFRAHNLRKLFITTCSNNIGKAMLSVEEGSNKTIELDLIAIFAGHKPSKGVMTTKYDAVEPEDIKPYYEQLIPYLSVNETNVKTYKSQDVILMEEKFAKIEKDKKDSKEILDALIDAVGADKIEKIINKKIQQ